MRKIAIYSRVSTDEQAKNKEGSISSQIHRLQLKIEEKNRYENGKWGKLVDTYKDEAFSGKNFERPEFQRMLNDVKKKRINTVMVTELSRLSRSVTDFLNFINELQKLNCDFICLQYDFDTTSPAGRVFMTIIMALAQFERELTVERIKNNCHARALRGLLNGGHPFLGYDKDTVNTGNLIINKKEATLIQEIFNYYLELGSMSKVAQELNRQGYTNKSWVAKN
ncbi:MAG: recombinase family protein [Bdellovibrionales bacterium]|nr:recombinase family protein [Bdellovibrionales bacterium]